MTKSNRKFKETVQVMLTKEQKQEIANYCQKNRWQLSAWARDILLQAVKENKG